MKQTKFKLISFAICPYVQRARTILLEKNVPHEVEYIKLSDPPAWFRDVSPMGRVPVLLVDGEPLFESLAICEYLDETTPGSLHPQDPFARAQNRAWIEFGNDILMLTRQYFSTNDEEMFSQSGASLRERFTSLEIQLSDGPFFNGPGFSIIDAVYAPIFRFHRGIARYSGQPDLINTPGLRRWGEALLAHASVQACVPNSYDADLDQFLAGQNSLLSRQKFK